MVTFEKEYRGCIVRIDDDSVTIDNGVSSTIINHNQFDFVCAMVDKYKKIESIEKELD